MKMPRFRLSTIMLLVAIAALLVALALSENRAARREAELQALRNLQNLMDYPKNAKSVAPRNTQFNAGAPLRK
jgi:hypothetical protein